MMGEPHVWRRDGQITDLDYRSPSGDQRSRIYLIDGTYDRTTRSDTNSNLQL